MSECSLHNMLYIFFVRQHDYILGLSWNVFFTLFIPSYYKDFLSFYYAVQSHRRYLAMVYVGFSEGLVLYVSEALGYLFRVILWGEGHALRSESLTDG